MRSLTVTKRIARLLRRVSFFIWMGTTRVYRYLLLPADCLTCYVLSTNAVCPRQVCPTDRRRANLRTLLLLNSKRVRSLTVTKRIARLLRRVSFFIWMGTTRVYRYLLLPADCLTCYVLSTNAVCPRQVCPTDRRRANLRTLLL